MTQDNPIIKKRFEEKMARLDKTSSSILVSWAFNCAVNLLSENFTGLSNEEMKKKILEWRDWFIEEYRNWFFEQEEIKTKSLTEEQVKKIDEDWQEHYDEISKLDDIKAEDKPKEF